MATLARPVALPPEVLDIGNPHLWTEYSHVLPYFAEMRHAGPVHWCPESMYGPYWNIVSHQHIMEVEGRPEIFSSSWEKGGITIADTPEGREDEPKMPMFIAMDRPKHTGQRRTVAPKFTPSAMDDMEAEIRARTGEVLDRLPRGEVFDWVDTVSIELTTQMLAILFDFPWEERRKLTFWSDWAGDIELVKNEELRLQRLQHMFECGAYFQNLWNAKIGKPQTPDLISMMIHSDAMAHMDHHEFIGNLILLIVGGNDTTRNTMSALAYGLDRFPAEREKLERDPSLIPNAVQEVIRWQTPLAHMRRTAKQDYELGGQLVREGDKLALWYVSANRDEGVFGPDADEVKVDRPNARRHLAFGHGIHRCVGARLAEMQIAILLEEMAKRRMRVNMLAEPTRVAACFVHGYRKMAVEITRY